MTDPNCNDQRIYIGRLGYEVELECIEAWDISGDTARIKGALVSTSVEEALVLRQQLNGYIGNLDEDVIPIVWNAHPAMNGFYRVKGGDVNFAGSSLRSGIFDFSLEVERVASSAGPLFESVITGAVRTNVHALTGQGWTGLPEAALGVDASVTSRASETGEIFPGQTNPRVFLHTTAMSEVVPFWLPPENYIDGAAQILVGAEAVTATDPSPGLAAYRTLVGQQVPNEPRLVALSNGVIRLFWDGTTNSAKLRMQIWHAAGREWRGGAAGTSKDYIVDGGGDQLGVADYPLTNAVVLRNSPEEVAVRFSFNKPPDRATIVPGMGRTAYLDVTLRRGARFASLFLSAPSGTGNRGVLRTPSEAATALTGGIMATAADAGGNTYVLASPAAQTNDLVNGALRESGTHPTTNIMIGYGETGLGANDPADIIDQYMAAQSERVIVVGR